MFQGSSLEQRSSNGLSDSVYRLIDPLLLTVRLNGYELLICLILEYIINGILYYILCNLVIINQYYLFN